MQFLMRVAREKKNVLFHRRTHVAAYNFLKQIPPPAGFLQRELQAYFTIQFPAAAPPAPIYISRLF